MVQYFKDHWTYAAIVLGILINVLIAMSSSPAFAADYGYNVVYEDVQVLARDMPTFREDTGLANSCIEAGGTKTHCICVTTILKHEMSVREYKAAVKLFAAGKSAEPTAMTSTKMSLRSQTYTPREINRINAFQRKLIEADGFEDRCTQAAQYFAAPAS